MLDTQTAGLPYSLQPRSSIFHPPQAGTQTPIQPDPEKLVKEMMTLIPSRDLPRGVWSNPSPTYTLSKSAKDRVEAELRSQLAAALSALHLLRKTEGHRRYGPTDGAGLQWMSRMSGMMISEFVTSEVASNEVSSELDGDLLELQNAYTFRDIASVTSFLQENSHLIHILLIARHNIVEHFENISSLVLEVVSDPDEPDADQLFLFIQSPLPVDVALKRLRHLGEKWWFQVVPDVQNKMAIDIEPA